MQPFPAVPKLAISGIPYVRALFISTTPYAHSLRLPLKSTSFIHSLRPPLVELERINQLHRDHGYAISPRERERFRVTDIPLHVICETHLIINPAGYEGAGSGAMYRRATKYIQ